MGKTYLIGNIVPRVTTIVSSATPTVNTDLCDDVNITALATAITSMTTGLSGTPDNFQQLVFRIKDDGTARAITWGASFVAMGTALPTTTVISTILTVVFEYDSVQTKWGCVFSTVAAVASSDWALDGNTVGAEKFIGTLDNFEFPVRTNNIERARFRVNGDVTVGGTGNRLSVGPTFGAVLSTAGGNDFKVLDAYSKFTIKYIYGTGSAGLVFMGDGISGTTGSPVDIQAYARVASSFLARSGVYYANVNSAATDEEPKLILQKNAGLINMPNLPTYTDDTAAGIAGLVAGDIYQQTTTHFLMVKQ